MWKNYLKVWEWVIAQMCLVGTNAPPQGGLNVAWNVLLISAKWKGLYRFFYKVHQHKPNLLGERNSKVKQETLPRQSQSVPGWQISLSCYVSRSGTYCVVWKVMSERTKHFLLKLFGTCLDLIACFIREMKELYAGTHPERRNVGGTLFLSLQGC